MKVSSVSPERCEMIDAVRASLGELDALERLGERADLVHLDQDRVGHALLDPAAQPVHVGHEEIVAHELHPLAAAARSASAQPSQSSSASPSSIDTIG